MATRKEEPPAGSHRRSSPDASGMPSPAYEGGGDSGCEKARRRPRADAALPLLIAVLLGEVGVCSSFSMPPPLSAFPPLLRSAQGPAMKRVNTALAATEGRGGFGDHGWGTKAPWGRERVASSEAGQNETVVQKGFLSSLAMPWGTGTKRRVEGSEEVNVTGVDSYFSTFHVMTAEGARGSGTRGDRKKQARLAAGDGSLSGEDSSYLSQLAGGRAGTATLGRGGEVEGGGKSANPAAGDKKLSPGFLQMGTETLRQSVASLVTMRRPDVRALSLSLLYGSNPLPAPPPANANQPDGSQEAFGGEGGGSALSTQVAEATFEQAGFEQAAKEAEASASAVEEAEAKAEKAYFESMYRYTDDGRRLSAVSRYSQDYWTTNLLDFFRSRVFTRIRGHLLVNVLMCALLALVKQFWTTMPRMTGLTHAITGSFLGLLVAFQAQTGYQRFWEARQAWGEVQKRVRSLARLVAAYVQGKEEVVVHVIRLLSAYPYVLKQHLRGESNAAEIATFLTEDEIAQLDNVDNRPLSIMTSLSIALAPLINDNSTETGARHNLVWQQMDGHIQMLMNAAGITERLATTPIPLSYSRHTSRFLSIWTFTLPFVLVHIMDPIAAMVGQFFICWALLGTEMVGHMIEEPFGGDGQNQTEYLPLLRYCKSIERDIAEVQRVRWGYKPKALTPEGSAGEELEEQQVF